MIAPLLAEGPQVPLSGRVDPEGDQPCAFSSTSTAFTMAKLLSTMTYASEAVLCPDWLDLLFLSF